MFYSKSASGKYQMSALGWIVAVPTVILLGNTRLGPLIVLSLIAVLVYQFVKPKAKATATATAVQV